MIEDGKPIGYDPDDQPPPPNLAQSLVAASGFTVYEAGVGLFDQPVLVYEATGVNANLVIRDHVGARLGACASRRLSRWRRRVHVLEDTNGDALARVRRELGVATERHLISGSIEGVIRHAGRDLTISSGRRSLGRVEGYGLRPQHGKEFRIFDPAGEQVGEIRGHEQFKSGLAAVYSYVLSIDPLLTGPLRPILVAVPMVLALIRHPQDLT